MASTLEPQWQPQWQKLSHASGNQADLLVRHAFSDEGYTVQITDLFRVWEENLTKQDILKKAEDTESSVDPSEGNDQYWILLRKIEAGIRGESGTELIYSHDDAEDALFLRITSPLPRPLPPLVWDLCLTFMGEDAVRSQMIMPLLSWTFVQHQQIDELVRLLAEKDSIINKVLDTVVESHGLEVESIFPSARHHMAGRRAKSREEVAKTVQGLAPFNKQTWRQNFKSDIRDGLKFEELVKGAFAGSDVADLRNLISCADFINGTAIPDTKPEKEMRTGTRKQVALERHPTPSAASDFEHVVKHTAARSRSTVSTVDNADDDTTDDEDFEQMPVITPRLSAKAHVDHGVERSPPRSSRGNSAVKSASARKVGRIGGSVRKGDDTSTTSSKSSQPAKRDESTSPRRQSKYDGDSSKPGVVEQGSELTSDMEVASPSASESTEPAITPKALVSNPQPRTKLGKIGGRSMKSSQSNAVNNAGPGRNEAPDSFVQSHQEVANVTPRKLGRIGGRGVTQTQNQSRESSPTPTPTPHHPNSSAPQSSNTIPPSAQKHDQNGDTTNDGAKSTTKTRTDCTKSSTLPESDQQRASRKREELRMELNAIDKCQVKRRRRF